MTNRQAVFTTCLRTCLGKQTRRSRGEKGVRVIMVLSRHTLCPAATAAAAMGRLVSNLARQIPLAMSRPFGEVLAESVLARPDKI